MAKKLNFEEGMQELEQLARSLESGEMSLDASFAAYERAMSLKKALEKLLDEGDEKIRILTAAGEEELDSEDIR